MPRTHHTTRLPALRAIAHGHPADLIALLSALGQDPGTRPASRHDGATAAYLRASLIAYREGLTCIDAGRWLRENAAAPALAEVACG